jgi:hypothetical protein
MCVGQRDAVDARALDFLKQARPALSEAGVA